MPLPPAVHLADAMATALTSQSTRQRVNLPSIPHFSTYLRRTTLSLETCTRSAEDCALQQTGPSPCRGDSADKLSNLEKSSTLSNKFVRKCVYRLHLTEPAKAIGLARNPLVGSYMHRFLPIFGQ